MFRYLIFFLFFLTNLFSENINLENQVEIQKETLKQKEPKCDCLILEDENSIICKFELLRQNIEKLIVVQWINPKGEISRSRDMIIPAGHGSIYDYRYIEGRKKGLWLFQVIMDNEKYSTKFTLK